jgi:hypothetical protein
MLAPLDGLERPHRRGNRLRGRWSPPLVERLDGVEELAPVPNRGDAKRHQVLGG